MTAEIHVGDIGTLFEVTVKDQDDAIVDLALATTKEILLKKPDGTTLTKAASFKTDGADGIVQYSLVSGDIDKNGLWSLQAHVILPSGEWRSSTVVFDVSANV